LIEFGFSFHQLYLLFSEQAEIFNLWIDRYYQNLSLKNNASGSNQSWLMTLPQEVLVTQNGVAQ
jgi:hypothetical protein